MLYAHNVQTTEYLRNGGVLEALRTLKQQGKARFIGFSTHTNTVEVIRAGLGLGFADVILRSYNYVLAEDPKLTELIAKAASSGIGIVAMKTQGNHGIYRLLDRCTASTLVSDPGASQALVSAWTRDATIQQLNAASGPPTELGP